MRMTIVGLGGLALAGCASNHPVENLPDNISTKPYPANPSAIVIDKVIFTHDQPITEPPAKCIAKTIDNQDVNLRSTSTWIGPYTGTAYNTTHSEQSGGGQVLLYSDDSESVAAGRESYSYTFGIAPISKVADFKVSIRREPGAFSVAFFDITAAQKDSGSVPNSGFVPVGAWPGARPLELYKVLQGVNRRLSKCLSNSGWEPIENRHDE